MFKSTNQQLGFTLIEMIVSLALFSVVITISVGAMLMLIASSDQLQREQSVMTNLSFALDSMTREIRTGTHYFCYSKNIKNNTMFDDSEDLNDTGPSHPFNSPVETKDCDNGNGSGSPKKYHGIAFNEGGASITGIGGRIVYFFDKDEGKIFRKVGAEPAQSIVSSGIFIRDMEFVVTGSNTLDSSSNPYKDQPTVTIYIEAVDVNDPSLEPYKIQTTVTQRILDL